MIQSTKKATEADNNTLDYHDLASIQIDGAIDMFDKKNYICALSLAGAARNLLRGLMQDQEKRFSDKFVSSVDKIKAQHDLHGMEESEAAIAICQPYNALKHYIESFCEQEWNVKELATTEICLAGSDFLTLTGQPRSKMIGFSEKINSELELKPEESK